MVKNKIEILLKSNNVQYNMLISIENIIIIIICMILSIVLIIFINFDKFSLNCKKNKEITSYVYKHHNVTYINTDIKISDESCLENNKKHEDELVLL